MTALLHKPTYPELINTFPAFCGIFHWSKSKDEIHTLIIIIIIIGGRNSSGGMATRYGLDGPGNESR